MNNWRRRRREEGERKGGGLGCKVFEEEENRKRST